MNEYISKLTQVIAEAPEDDRMKSIEDLGIINQAVLRNLLEAMYLSIQYKKLMRPSK